MRGWQVGISVGLALLVILGGAYVMVLRPEGGIGVGKPPSRAKGVLRLATFNVEGLFGEGAENPSSPEHLEAIAEAIRLIDADILALQDVESLEALEGFRDGHLADMGYAYVASLDAGHERGIENAVLSRHPLETSRVWRALKLGGSHPASAGGKPNKYGGKVLRFRRSPLMVRVSLPSDGSREGEALTLFVVEHKGGNRFDYWREAEARAIVRLAEEVGMNQRIVVLGSFHAEPEAVSIGIYLAGGFVDALGVEEDSERWATESTGERTDFILANRVAMGDLDGEAGFVLGGALAELRDGVVEKATHLPVVIGLRVGEE